MITLTKVLSIILAGENTIEEIKEYRRKSQNPLDNFSTKQFVYKRLGSFALKVRET